MSNRKRLTKRQVAKSRAKKVVITPRKHEKPILELGGLEGNCITGDSLIIKVAPRVSQEDVEFMTLTQGRKVNPDLFLV